MAYGLHTLSPLESWRSALTDARQCCPTEHDARRVASIALDVWRIYMRVYREHDRLRRKIEGRS